MVPKNYTVKEVFNAADLSFVFEFYCSRDAMLLSKDLAKILGKQVVVTTNEEYLPTFTSSILLKEYDGNRPRYQLKTGYFQYNELNPMLSTLLMWLNEFASLDYSTNMKTRLSFNHSKLQTLSHISNMDPGKLILKINEEYLYDKFPEGKDSPFAMSIKKLVPLNTFANASNKIYNIRNNFQIPMNEYYAIDFTDYTRGSIVFNYIMGEMYTDKVDKVFETLKYYIITTYQSLNESNYTKEERNELQKLTEDYHKMRASYFNPRRFLQEYENINVFVDLQSNEQVIVSNWDKIRTPLFELMFEADLKKGEFNWDSEAGVFQLKKAEIVGGTIKNFELVKCELDGCVLERVHAWHNTITNSRIAHSTLIENNKIEEAFLFQTRADRGNTINDSYISNNGEIINCKVNESIVKNAGIGKNAKLDEQCTIIQPKQNLEPLRQGIEVEEKRDYNWIKSFRAEEPEAGFGNEYKTDY